MDDRTGRIYEFNNESETFKKLKEIFGRDVMIPLKRLPRRNCKKCYGRGYVGTDDKGKHVPCSCVL